MEKRRLLWTRAASYAILAIYLLLGSEWLFQITKPSFFAALSTGQSVMALLVAPIPYVGVALAWVALSWLAERTHLPRRIVLSLYALPPALILGSCVFLLIDNFTYTVFGFGVASVRGSIRFAYAAVFVGLFAWQFRLAIRSFRKGGSAAGWAMLASGILVALSVGVSALAMATRVSLRQADLFETSPAERPPDIFLISGDAFQVSLFERYGNPVESMSFFDVLGPNAVAFENSFPNSNRTGSATALVLTGRHATTTGKLNSARFFNERDAYLHLPGLLRGLDYRSIQIGADHHVDSFHWGMRDAFDVTRRTIVEPPTFDRLSDRTGGRLDSEFHFSQVMANRILERLQHTFGGKLIVQSHLAYKLQTSEADRLVMVDRLLAFLHENPGPIFAQLHTMATRIRPKGTTAPLGTELDEYMDIIVDYLKQAGRFENAIIVIWSDHGQQYETNLRLPLIIKFPRRSGIPAENLGWNTQTLDIAPTILDYMNLPIPEWMEGRSLLKPIDRYEPIFGAVSAGKKTGIDPGPDAPVNMGGLTELGVIVCDHWFSAELESGQITQSQVVDHTTPCDPGDIPDAAEFECMIGDHLAERGYKRVVGSECR